MIQPLQALKLCRAIYVWQDTRGVRHWQPFVLQDQTPAITTPVDDLTAALAAMSCAGQVLVYRQPYALLGGVAVAGAYGTALDVLELQVEVEGGGGMLVDVPAPLEDLFPDGATLNMADARVAALEAAMQAAVASETLKDVVAIVSGRRSRIVRPR